MTDRAFGFGCFHFAPRPGAPEQSVAEYLKSVSETLTGLGCSEEHIETDCDPDERDARFATPNEVPDISNGEEPYPSPPGGRVSFVLEIPEREQMALLSSRFLLTHSQRFRVEIRYGFRMPVALVETLDPVRRPSPSQGVRIVREWLAAKVGGATTALDFQCLGPSPLHAEFFLASTEEPSDDPWLFRLDVIEQRGYDHYQFEFNPYDISEEEALDVLLDDLAEELDLFYEIVGSSVRHLRMWDRAESLTWSVVRLHETRGLRAWVRKALKTRRVLNEAFVALAELEGTARLSGQEIERSARSTYTGDEPAYLERLVGDEREDIRSYPIGESRGLLELIEKRRLSGREVLALLASAVGGGLIGALVAALVASGPAQITIPPPRIVPIACGQEKSGHIVCSLTTSTSTQPNRRSIVHQSTSR